MGAGGTSFETGGRSEGPGRCEPRTYGIAKFKRMCGAWDGGRRSGGVGRCRAGTEYVNQQPS